MIDKMTQLNPQKKIEDANARWRVVIEKGTKRRRQVLRFISPHFVARGVGPCDVTTPDLGEIVNALAENDARDHFRQPDSQNRYAASGDVDEAHNRPTLFSEKHGRLASH
ncbi:hypothetical protein [uncultured Rhodoblastus sp.]|uniref:hypothetical protein n=1 Tax=uncultured Rhodoblastus sp. TaxID=543037 RepID=UPI0025FA7E27|nr:hypothetical protein [uncultured Rhodoblastus sp.]